MKHVYVLAGFLLSACAGPSLTQYDVELERHRMVAVTECYRSKASSRTFADPRDQAIFLMAEALASKGIDSCAQIAGVNAHEARVKIAENQNNAFGNVLGVVTKGITAIAGIVVGGDVLKEGMKNSGDKTNITGDNNTHVNGPDQSSTTTTTTTSAHYGTLE